MEVVFLLRRPRLTSIARGIASSLEAAKQAGVVQMVPLWLPGAESNRAHAKMEAWLRSSGLAHTVGLSALASGLTFVASPGTVVGAGRCGDRPTRRASGLGVVVLRASPSSTSSVNHENSFMSGSCWSHLAGRQWCHPTRGVLT